MTGEESEPVTVHWIYEYILEEGEHWLVAAMLAPVLRVALWMEGLPEEDGEAFEDGVERIRGVE